MIEVRLALRIKTVLGIKNSDTITGCILRQRSRKF
jgi:hypothetical protein